MRVSLRLGARVKPSCNMAHGYGQVNGIHEVTGSIPVSSTNLFLVTVAGRRTRPLRSHVR